MLTRNLSLKTRAAMLFVAIYFIMFFGVLVVVNAQQGLGATHGLGPSMAVTYAAERFGIGHAAETPAAGSRFEDLRRENPGLWVIFGRPSVTQVVGTPPSEARSAFAANVGLADSARLTLGGQAGPSSQAALRRFETSQGSLWIMGGGVDPETISWFDAVWYFLIYEDLAPLLLIGGIGLIAMLAAMPLFSRALRRVATQAEAVSPSDPNQRIDEARAPSELLPLIRSFNATLDRLADELQRRRRFIADVAHELRTPLSIASLQVEALEQSSTKKDLARVMTRMSHLVGQMLDVERLSAAEPVRNQLDLREIAREVIAELAPIALGAGYDLSLDHPPQPVWVRGDAHALGRAVSNLVSNAISHGGGAGTIKVAVVADGSLTVADEGPGVPAAIRDDLFEPFRREPWDRDGCGLGLHLSREILRAHGGDVMLLESDRGALFRLTLPLSGSGREEPGNEIEPTR